MQQWGGGNGGRGSLGCTGPLRLELCAGVGMGGGEEVS